MFRVGVALGVSKFIQLFSRYEGLFGAASQYVLTLGVEFSDRHGFWGRFVKSLQNTASRRFSVAFHSLGNGRRPC